MELREVKELQPITWFLLVMLVLVTIVPGLLLIYLFNENLFLQVESVKIIFLSISITMPVWALNTIVCGFINDDSMSVIEHMQFCGLLGSFFSFVPLYAPAVVKLFTDIEGKCAVIIAGGLEILVLIILIIMVRINNKKTKNKE